jgi:hypothetical protein
MNSWQKKSKTNSTPKYTPLGDDIRNRKQYIKHQLMIEEAAQEIQEATSNIKPKDIYDCPY